MCVGIRFSWHPCLLTFVLVGIMELAFKLWHSGVGIDAVGIVAVGIVAVGMITCFENMNLLRSETHCYHG